jgi:cell division septation protein DedD
MKARRIALLSVLLAALAAIAVPLGALEVTNGMVKLTLHEGIGRFSLAGLGQASGASFTPLLVAQDPRSSMVSILVSDRVIRLGESSDFLEAVENTATGARFTWTSKQLVVTETFSFIGAPGSDVASGVRVDLQVTNVSEQDLAVAVRYLFDTWLGEASSVHFRTDTVAGLTRELTITKDERPAYWVSPLADNAEGFGFQCMLSGEGVTVPDRVVFANWKRLSDSAWSYTTSAARTFSQAPYSMNDSAVGQYYDSQPIPRGGNITVTLALGRASPSGLTLQTAATTVAVAETPVTTAAAETTAVEAPAAVAPAETTPTEAPAIEAPAEPTPAPDPVTEARTDLASINELLRKIDLLLADGSAITAEELAALEQSIAALKERSALYGTGRE